jgi:hypothetical protein
MAPFQLADAVACGPTSTIEPACRGHGRGATWRLQEKPEEHAGRGRWFRELARIYRRPATSFIYSA